MAIAESALPEAALSQTVDDKDFERWPEDDEQRSAGWFGARERLWQFERDSKGKGQSNGWDTLLQEDIAKFGQDGDV
jgi:hypothetical protein